jgi:hypothetical protein
LRFQNSPTSINLEAQLRIPVAKIAPGSSHACYLPTTPVGIPRGTTQFPGLANFNDSDAAGRTGWALTVRSGPRWRET